MYFLGSAFFKLFLHWSHSVKHVFSHLIAYKLYGDALQQVQSPSISTIHHRDVLSRY